jgi:hypothetical protein
MSSLQPGEVFLPNRDATIWVLVLASLSTSEEVTHPVITTSPKWENAAASCSPTESPMQYHRRRVLNGRVRNGNGAHDHRRRALIRRPDCGTMFASAGAGAAAQALKAAFGLSMYWEGLGFNPGYQVREQGRSFVAVSP